MEIFFVYTVYIIFVMLHRIYIYIYILYYIFSKIYLLNIFIIIQHFFYRYFLDIIFNTIYWIYNIFNVYYI